MATVEVHIGDRFYASFYPIGYNISSAARAVWLAGGIAQSNISIPSTDIHPSEKKYILSNCAVLIVELARISVGMYDERVPSDFCIDPEYYESLTESTSALLSSTTRVLDLVNSVANSRDKGSYQRDIMCEIQNSIRLACMVATKVGETNLEPYIYEQFH